jgi:hypothetical protein
VWLDHPNRSCAELVSDWGDRFEYEDRHVVARPVLLEIEQQTGELVGEFVRGTRGTPEMASARRSSAKSPDGARPSVKPSV